MPKAFFLNKFEIQQEREEKIARETGRPLSKKRGRSGSRSKSTPAPQLFNCSTCGLDIKSASGKRSRVGRGNQEILIVSSSPPFGGQYDDREVKYLQKTLDMFDIDLRRDCTMTYTAACATKAAPTATQLKCCKSNLDKDIEEVKPKLIIALGSEAINSVLCPQGIGKLAVTKIHGKVIPSQHRNCWVLCSFAPFYYLAEKGDHDAVFFNDIAGGLAHKDTLLPKPLSMEDNVIITDSSEAIDLLDNLCLSASPVAFDYETTCFTPYQQDIHPKLLTVGLACSVDKGFSIPIGMPGIFTLMEESYITGALQRFLKSNTPKVVQNHSMEEIWSADYVGEGMNNWLHDTMVSNHVLNGVLGGNSLEFQTFEMVGIEYKNMVDTANLINESVEDVCNYNALDARYTLMAFFKQYEELKDDVFHAMFTSCIPVLTRLKRRGVLIDTKILNKFAEDTQASQDECLRKLQQNTGVVQYEAKRAEDGEKVIACNTNSPAQQGVILYDILNEPLIGKKRSCAEPVLKEMHKKTKNSATKEFINLLLQYKKYNSFLKRVTEYQGLVDKDGYVHPSFNLHVAESFRSSATGPNIQNVFKHDKELVQFRKCVIPSIGNIFLECDYGALEVRVIAMISKDPVLIKQIQDSYDLHRYWASRVFNKPQDQITSSERYEAKNGFVFPSFYGSVPESIERSFPGIPLAHIQNCQEAFWEMYPRVKAWQLEVVAFYRENGYIKSVGGFKRSGPLSKFQLYNTPIQGTAFHLLLDGLQKVDDEMLRRGIKSRAIMEVHDSIMFDTHPDEIEEIIQLTNDILCSKRFEWQGDVPLLLEWQLAESNWLGLEDLEV